MSEQGSVSRSGPGSLNGSVVGSHTQVSEAALGSIQGSLRIYLLLSFIVFLSFISPISQFISIYYLFSVHDLSLPATSVFDLYLTSISLF